MEETGQKCCMLHYCSYVIIGLIVGFVLYSVPTNSKTEIWFVGFVTLSALYLLLAWDKKNFFFRLITSLVLGAIFSLMITQLEFRFSYFIFVIMLILAIYFSTAYHNSVHEDGTVKINYSTFFKHAWNNLFIIASAFAFSVIVNSIILYWGQMLQLIDYRVVSQMVHSKWYNTIITPIFFVIGLLIAQKFSHCFYQLREVKGQLARPLLKLLSLIAITLLIALIYSLFEKSFLADAFLVFTLIYVFILNLVVQDVSEEKVFCHKGPFYLVNVAVIILPLFPLIALIHTLINVMQTRMSVDRYYLIITSLVLLLMSAGYAISALKKSDRWLAKLPSVNLVVCRIFFIIVILLSTPWLSPAKFSRSSEYYYDGYSLNGHLIEFA